MGHEKLNDVDYWEVDPSMNLPRKVGSVVMKDVTKDTGGVIGFVADWTAPDGTVVVTENREMRFFSGPGGLRGIDVDFRLRPRRHITISDHADGILGLRLGLPFEEKNGGRVRNFTGDVGADKLYARRSPWIDYTATIDGERVGVAVMDHPLNYNFPTRWKVRTFASIFVSAFGEQEFFHEAPFKMAIPKTAKNAGLVLEPEDELRFRYRVLIHAAGLNMDEAWREFAQSYRDGSAPIVDGARPVRAQ
jgi:hypothetical protein